MIGLVVASGIKVSMPLLLMIELSNFCLIRPKYELSHSSATTVYHMSSGHQLMGQGRWAALGLLSIHPLDAECYTSLE